MNYNPFYSPPPGRFYTPIYEAVDPSLYEYNSNSTVPVYHQKGLQPIAQDFMNDIERQFIGAKEVNSTYLARQQSAGDISAQQQSNIIQYAVQPDPVIFPGFVPKMKNVSVEDVAVPMKEGFSLPDSLQSELEKDKKLEESFKHVHSMSNKKHQTQTCIDFLNHVRNCPLCQRYFKCDNRIFYTIIIGLILIFAIIIYFITRDCAQPLIKRSLP